MTTVRPLTESELKRYERVNPANALKWDPADYGFTSVSKRVKTPEGVREARAEYTRLRDIAQKRIKRLAADPYWSTTQSYKRYREGFAKLRDIRDEMLPIAVNSVAKFIASRESTVASLNDIRDRSIQTFHYNGYDFVNKENYRSFGEFMGAVKQLYQVKQIPDSDQVAELFNEANRGGINWGDIFDQFKGKDDAKTKDVFDWWVKERKTIRKRVNAMKKYDREQKAKGKKTPAGTYAERLAKRYEKRLESEAKQRTKKPTRKKRGGKRNDKS